MPRPLRIAIVFVLLAGAGAALGALAAGGALMCSYMLRGMWDPYFYGDAVTAAWLGSMLGGVLGPTCALGFLRRTPLWLALGGPTAATFIGGTLGQLVGVGLFTAPLAFIAAVIMLHLIGEEGRTDRPQVARKDSRITVMPAGRHTTARHQRAPAESERV